MIGSLTAPVGRGGENLREDVRTVQELLNQFRPLRPAPPLAEDGYVGCETLDAILAVQRYIGLGRPDGRIDPGGRTWRAVQGDGCEAHGYDSAHEAMAGCAGGCLTLAQLREIMPNAKPEKAAQCIVPLISAMDEFEISANRLREAAFLAQIAHESGDLRYFREIWGPTPTQRRYEGRADLGNVMPGDGERYKGRGPLQITGAANYKKYGERLGLPLFERPDMAEDPKVGFRVAGAFWETHGLNALADEQAFKRITKIINGGYNGLEDRVKYYTRAKKVLANA